MASKQNFTYKSNFYQNYQFANNFDTINFTPKNVYKVVPKELIKIFKKRKQIER